MFLIGPAHQQACPHILQSLCGGARGVTEAWCGTSPRPGARRPGPPEGAGLPSQPQRPVSPAVADIPGIIRGAHQNRGLGSTFLRHIERCHFLLFIVDLSEPEPWTQVEDLKFELEKYEAGLSKRPHVVVANKIDLPQARAALPQLRARLGPSTVIALSAATGENLEELLLCLQELHGRHVAAELRW